MKPGFNQYDHRYLRLLQMAPFQRHRGGWRFGTNRINDEVINRLVDSGRVVRIGDEIMLPRKVRAS